MDCANCSSCSPRSAAFASSSRWRNSRWSPTSAHRALLEQCGLAERVLERPRQVRDWLPFLRTLCRPRADVCLAFNDDLPTMLVAGATWATHRLGFCRWHGVPAVKRSSTLAPPRLARPCLHTGARPRGAGTLAGSCAGFCLPSTGTRSTSLCWPRESIPESRLFLLCPRADESRAWIRSHWGNAHPSAE